MTFDYYKYLIVCEFSNAAEQRIKDLAEKWCILEDKSRLVMFVATKKQWDSAYLRNTVTGGENLDCIVIGLLTTGKVSAIGNIYTNADTWKWFCNVCTKDIDIIREKIKNEENGLVPDSAINTSQNKTDKLSL